MEENKKLQNTTGVCDSGIFQADLYIKNYFAETES
jgi:hypothetical protein